MPSTIPYDPSLALGNLIEPTVLDNLIAIAALQEPVDAAQETLNSYIAMKRSLDMTMKELVNMSVNVDQLEAKTSDVGRSISQAATEYATTVIAQEAKIQPLRAKALGIHKSFESPIDYVRSTLKTIPLSSDSLKMDAQYFSFDSNDQSANNSMNNIKKYISGTVDILGVDASTNTANATVDQIAKQREAHSIAGTLIITAVCTHKQADVFAPFILDVDKAVRIWNKLFPGTTDKIKMNDQSDMERIAMEEGTDGEKSMNIISGATYGSSFVGMVHILRSDDSSVDEKMESTASTLQAQMEVGAWFKKEGGGFGVDKSFSTDVKTLLSHQTISSHISLITMGCIPTIKSSQVQLGVKTFADFDPAKMMAQVAALQNLTSSDIASVADSAAKARTGGDLVALKSADITSVMTGLQSIDDGKDSVMDIGTLMTAFDDYVTAAIKGGIGVPINYYVKPITRAQIAQMWMSKYFPNKYLAISGDDSKTSGTGTPGSTGDGSTQ